MFIFLLAHNYLDSGDETTKQSLEEEIKTLKEALAEMYVALFCPKTYLHTRNSENPNQPPSTHQNSTHGGVVGIFWWAGWWMSACAVVFGIWRLDVSLEFAFGVCLGVSVWRTQPHNTPA